MYKELELKMAEVDKLLVRMEATMWDIDEKLWNLEPVVIPDGFALRIYKNLKYVLTAEGLKMLPVEFALFREDDTDSLYFHIFDMESNLSVLRDTIKKGKKAVNIEETLAELDKFMKEKSSKLFEEIEGLELALEILGEIDWEREN